MCTYENDFMQVSWMDFLHEYYMKFVWKNVQYMKCQKFIYDHPWIFYVFYMKFAWNFMHKKPSSELAVDTSGLPDGHIFCELFLQKLPPNVRMVFASKCDDIPIQDLAQLRSWQSYGSHRCILSIQCLDTAAWAETIMNGTRQYYQSSEYFTAKLQTLFQLYFLPTFTKSSLPATSTNGEHYIM